METTNIEKLDTEKLDKPTPSPKKKSKKLLHLLLAIILLVLIGYGWKFYSDMEAAAHQEELDYAVLSEENYNIEDFRTFLEKYPQSVHFRAAEQRLRELEILADDWKNIHDSKNVNKFVDFKNRYSDAHYTRLCNLKIDSLDWKDAVELNTSESYKQYIDRHPEGLFIAEAITGHYESNKISQKEENSIYEVCRQFFSAIETNDADAICAFLAPEIENFVDIKFASKADILYWATQEHNAHELLSYLVKRDFKITKENGSEQMQTYTSTFTLDQYTTDKEGNKNIETLKAIAKLNKDYQICSLSLQNI